MRPSLPPIAAAGAAAAATAPYLARLQARWPDIAPRVVAEGPHGVLAEERAAAENAAGPSAEVWRRLRQAKTRTHLALALGDLSGALDLDAVTGALSRFADRCVAAALGCASRELVAAGDLRAAGPDLPGLIVLAMGKHGASELNYSSDIDITLFFERDRLPVAAGKDPQRVAVRLAQAFVKALESPTEDGYVFRTDLRLRPDPGSTPVVVSLAAAAHYYQTLGQNWERAAFIKARPVAGDLPAAEAFLEGLEPFLWRRHLDFAAIDDLRSIKRQILAQKGARGDLEDPAFDVKLGRGGIRDIELFAQTQQLILGGRSPQLRSPRTREALAQLAAAGAISTEACATLSEAYVVLRQLEHRIQMLADEQTHRLPAAEPQRALVAQLAGFGGAAALDAAVLAVRRAVIAEDERLFRPDESLGAPEGRLVFTGVDDDPETLSTLRRMGFEAPEAITAKVRGWRHGRIRATRSERARELLTRLTPKLLRALAETGAGDLAFQRVAGIIEALPAGVQFFALLDARADVLARLASVTALAPALAQALARKPATLDAVSEPTFLVPLGRDAAFARRDTALAVIQAAQSFEATLNALRRFKREEQFRIDLQLLERIATPEDASRAHADLADACVTAVAEAAVAETARRAGPLPGPFMIAALGKFGGRELAHGSDLDLMLIYDAPAEASEIFAKLTQRLITGLSAQTEEGALYDVDLQLRPSGSKGPVAVRLAAFERYYGEDAWTWELLALTRLRPAAGDATLCERVMAAARAALSKPRNAETLRADTAAMRARMDKERPPKGPWDLKLRPGGLVDIEFAAQALAIARAAAHGGEPVWRANTGEALAVLAATGALEPGDARELSAAWRLFSACQHGIRVGALGGDADAAGAPFQQRLAELAGRESFAALTSARDETAAQVRATFKRLIG